MHVVHVAWVANDGDPGELEGETPNSQEHGCGLKSIEQSEMGRDSVLRGNVLLSHFLLNSRSVAAGLNVQLNQIPEKREGQDLLEERRLSLQ